MLINKSNKFLIRNYVEKIKTKLNNFNNSYIL